MRWLNDSPRRDDGVATIFLIIAMTAIVVGAALAIDVGHYVVEARSAQNSADATALAVATDCALRGAPIADYSPYRKVGQTISSPACGDGQATITVTKEVEKIFVQPVGEVDRSATAIWGTLASASTLPIVISDCEFDPGMLEGTANIILYLDDPKPQSGCSSLSGGFSQLAGDGCEVPISAGSLAPGKPGADLQKVVPCITNPTSPRLPHDVLIPIYDANACAASDCKGKGPYLIRGFAMFKVTGYSFNGNNYAGSLGKKCPDDNERGRYCIQGDFVRFTTSRGTVGPSTDFGAYAISLYS
jgi:Putative Flp pilus-assembly TadE/G-like